MGARREEESLSLPQLQNGVLGIGDLWDAESFRRPGLNLFGNEFNSADESNLTAFSVEDQRSRLVHEQSSEDSLIAFDFYGALTAALLGGFIKIEGGLEFQTQDEKECGRETILWAHNVTTSNVRPTSNDVEELRRRVDPHVLQLLRSGAMRATHYVSQMNVGANATGSISIVQSNKNTLYRVGAILSGEINLVVVSAKLEASAHISEETRVSNYQKLIKLRSLPPVQPPTDIDKFLALGGHVFAQMQNTSCIPSLPNVKGVPKLFRLLPIDDLLAGGEEGEPDGKTRLNASRVAAALEAISDEEFLAVLRRLRDLDVADYCKRALLQKRAQLFKLVSDVMGGLGGAIGAVEKEMRRKAKEFKQRIYSKMLDFLHDDAGWEEAMGPILLAFHREDLFNQEKIEELVRGWIDRGNALLGLINIDEGDETSPVRLLSSAKELLEWMGTERTPQLIWFAKMKEEVLESRGPSANLAAIANIPRTLQKLSKGLGNLEAQVGVAYPSVSEGTPLRLLGRGGGGRVDDPNKPYLQFKSATRTVVWEEEEEVEFTLRLLEVVVGGAWEEDGSPEPIVQLKIRVYGVYAEQLGISLPLRRWPEEGVGSLAIEILPSLVPFLQRQVQTLSLYPSRAALLAGSSDRGWRLVGSVQALNSAANVLHALQRVQRSFSGTGEREGEPELALCNLEAGEGSSSEAPLLFILHGDRLKALCVDYLDLLTLLHQLEASGELEEAQLALLSPSSVASYSMQPQRLAYAQKIASDFDVHLPIKEYANSPFATPPPQLLHLQRAADGALRMVASTLAPTARGKSIRFPSALVHVARGSFEQADKEAFEELLRNSSGWWNGMEEEVTGVEWEKMSADLNGFVRDGHFFLHLLLTAIEFLGGVEATYNMPEEEEEEEMEPTREVRASEPGFSDFGELVAAILAEEACSEFLRAQLDYFLGVGHHQRILARFLQESLKLELGRVLKEAVGWGHLLQLIEIANELTYEEELSEGWQERLLQEFIPARILLDPTCAALMDSHYGETRALLSGAFGGRRRFQMVELLSGCCLHPLQSFLNEHLPRILGWDDLKGLVGLIQALWSYLRRGESGVEVELNAWSYLWRNSRFVALVVANLGRPLLLNALLVYLCPEGKIPAYIPRPVKTALTAHMAAAPFAFRRVWPSLAEAVDTWQVFWSRKLLPQDFPAILLHNMLNTVSKFKEQLLQTVGPSTCFWDEEVGHFSAPWNLDLLLIIIQLCTAEGGSSTKLLPSHPVRNKAARVEKDETKSGVERRPEPVSAIALLQLGPHSPEAERFAGFYNKVQFRAEGGVLWPPSTHDQEHSRFNTLEHFFRFASGAPSILAEVCESLQSAPDGPYAIPLILPTPPAPILLLPLLELTSWFKGAQTSWVTILSAGPTKNNSGSFLNKYLLGGRATFSGSAPPGYVEITRLDRKGETLLLHLHGDALQTPLESSPLLRWLASSSSRLLVLWNCEPNLTWSILQRRRRELEEGLGGVSDSLLFDMCVDPSDDVARQLPDSMSIRPGAEKEEEIVRKLSEWLERALGVSSSAKKVAPPPAIKPLPLPPLVGAIRDLVASHSIKLLKMSFIPLSGSESAKVDVGAHWRRHPAYAQLMTYFSQLALHCREGSDELHLLERCLHQLCSESEERRRLEEQVEWLESQLSQENELIYDLLGQLEDARGRLEHQHSLSVAQLLLQLIRIHTDSPQHLPTSLDLPRLVGKMLATGLELQLPSNSTQLIDSDFVSTCVASSELAHLRLLLMTVLGEEAGKRHSVLSRIFAEQRPMLWNQGPRSGLYLRILRLSPALQEELYTNEGRSFDAVLLVIVPQLGSSHEQERHGGRDVALMSLALAMSHVSLLCMGEGGEESVYRRLELAMTRQLITPSPQSLTRGSIATLSQLAVLVPHESCSDENKERLSATLGRVQTFANSAAGHALGAHEASYFRTFAHLEQEVELDEVVYNLTPPTGSHGGPLEESEYQTMTRLQGVIIQKLKRGVFSRGAYELESWAKELNVRYPSFLALQKELGELVDQFEFQSVLLEFGQSITEAFKYHSEGYMSQLEIEMEEVPRRAEEAEDEGEEEDERAIQMVRDNIRNWIDSLLGTIYELCALESGAPCDACRVAGEKEEELLRRWPTQTPHIQTTRDDEVRRNLDDTIRRIEQVGTCLELELNPTALLLEFRRWGEGGATPNDVWSPWAQFLSTKCVVVPSWTVFVAEVKALYPPLFWETIGRFDVEEEELLEELRTFPAYASALDDGNEVCLHWTLFRIIKASLLTFAGKVLRPPSGLSQALHFRRGDVRKLQLLLNEMIGRVLLGGGEARSLLLSFVYKIHGVGLQLFWSYAVALEGDDWTRTFNPLASQSPEMDDPHQALN